MKERKVIAANNCYDKYYNSFLKTNKNSKEFFKNHIEYITIENEEQNLNNYFFEYLIERQKTMESILKLKNLDNQNIDGFYNFFRKDIFLEIFKKLKEKWPGLFVEVFTYSNENNEDYNESFINNNFNKNYILEINWGGVIPLTNIPDFFNDKINKNEKFMICRVGNVEVDVLKQYKNNKIQLIEKFNEFNKILCSHLSDKIFEIKDNYLKKYDFIELINKSNISYDLLRLSTNAGFYITEQEKEFNILESWINEYLKAYRNCDGFFRCDGMLKYQELINEEFKPSYTIRIEQDIYNLMHNKNVLVISPFAKQINTQIETGNISKLFKKNILIQSTSQSTSPIKDNKEYEIFVNCNIKTIETPITIFGNPVDKSWKDTFDKTCSKIKEYCEHNKIDIVIASCGCYSMPICNYVYEKLNISSLCFGNAIHQLFGLMQNDFYAFDKDIINEEYWIKIDSSVIRNERLMNNMKKIDISGGKYVKNEYNFKCIITGENCLISDNEVLISREGMQRNGCTSRLRAMIYLLSKELFGKPTLLNDFPENKNIKGIGMSDAPEYAIPLSKKLGYINTYYEKEPYLDIYKLTKEQINTYDFILTTDVFEHIPPYPGLDIAFKNLYDLLKPNGFVIFGVPYSLDEKTIEHFPNLYNYHFTKEDYIVLHNTTIEGKYERFENLCFHGGPGDISQNKGNGSTLEMRVFCKKDIEEKFYKAGFKEIEYLNIEDPIVKSYGIYWEGPWSLCMIVRKR